MGSCICRRCRYTHKLNKCPNIAESGVKHNKSNQFKYICEVHIFLSCFLPVVFFVLFFSFLCCVRNIADISGLSISDCYLRFSLKLILQTYLLYMYSSNITLINNFVGDRYRRLIIAFGSYSISGLRFSSYMRVVFLTSSSRKQPIYCCNPNTYSFYLFNRFTFHMYYCVRPLDDKIRTVRRGNDRMLIGFTSTCSISAYHH